MSQITIHPRAQIAFDAEAEQVLMLAEDAYLNRSVPQDGFLVLNGLSIPIAVMWQSSMQTGGPPGDATGVSFAVRDHMVRIEAEDFLMFARFVEKVQSRSELVDVVSISAMRQVAVNWMQRRLADEITTSFTQYLLEWSSASVAARKVIFPIYGLRFDGTWGTGGVVIRNLSFDELHSWFATHTATTADIEGPSGGYNRWRGTIGGAAVAIVELVAEPVRARELAFEKVDRVLSILRSYSPALLHPLGRSFCTPLGMEHIERLVSFLIDEDGRMQISERVLDGRSDWHLSEDDLRSFVEAGFLEASSLLDAERPSEFQSRILRALDLYSRAALESRIESKLLYILSALESLLLASDSEPIGANLSRRFAYFVGENLEQRKEIQKRLKSVYELRSRFVHHGYGINNMLLLENFFEDAWMFFRQITVEAKKFSDKATFLARMDDEMLAGPTAYDN